MRGISGSIGRSVTTVLCVGGADLVNGGRERISGLYAEMFHVKHRGAAAVASGAGENGFT
jgi:hypothetical protein